MRTFLQQHAASVIGTLSGFDRLRFRGTLRSIANAGGLTSYLNCIGVLMKDFKHYVLQVTDQIRTATIQLARDAGRPIQFVKPSARKELIARDIAERDGIKEGLIAVLSCVEPCMSFDLRSDRAKGKLVLVPKARQCLHYYQYHQHPVFGFMHVRGHSTYRPTFRGR